MGKAGSNAPAVVQNQVLYKSPLGTPVYADLDITGDSYTINGQMFTFPNIKIPTAVFKVDREHIVIRTQVNGEQGEILEYIGTKNWEIDCDLILSSDANLLYPVQDVQNLITMLGSNQVLSINSWYLNQFGITNIVILHEGEPQVEGDLNNQRISFKALSVTPFALSYPNKTVITSLVGNNVSAGGGSTDNNVA